MACRRFFMPPIVSAAPTKHKLDAGEPAMSMLNEGSMKLKTTARAWDARLAWIERRFAEIAETGEQRVVILRDAMADFAAGELREGDEIVAALKGKIAELNRRLERKIAADQQVTEIATRLEERTALATSAR